ncbi:hypothetical protein [Actinokineospora sp.]|uniref:hypothetical protein n=1 Tax=Actinokineospora sp. TaxID=1872133 RepID=UPI004037998B
MDADAIYRNFHDGQGGQNLMSGADIVNALAHEHDDETDAIQALAVRLEAAWQGEAAGAAQRGLLPITIALQSTSSPARTADDLVSRQAESFDSAKARVEPVPPMPSAPPGWQVVFSTGEVATYQNGLRDHFTASQRNVDVMTGYEDASTYNADNMPDTFGTLIVASAPVGVAPPPTEPPPGGPDDGNGRPTVDQVDGRTTQSAWSQGPASGVIPQQYVPPTGGPQPPTSGPPTPPPTQGPTPLPPGLRPPGGRTPGQTPPGARPDPTPRPGSSTSGQAPDARPGSRLPGVGPGTGDGRGGPGTRNPAGSGAEPGARAGQRPESGYPGQRAADGPARGGNRGGQPLGGAGGMGGARGDGGEDYEHALPAFLHEHDPEDIFGTDQITAPPVIGG